MKRRLAASFVAALLVALSGTAEGAEKPDKAPAKQFDAKYVTDDFFGAVIFHPQQLAKSAAAAPLVKQLDKLGLPPVLDPRRIEQVVMLIPVPPQQYVRDGDGPSFILRFTKLDDADGTAADLLGTCGQDQIVEAKVAGKKCHKFAAPAEGMDEDGRPRRHWTPPAMTCAVDDRTVLVCIRGEADMQRMLGGGAVKSPLAEGLRKVDPAHDAVVVFALQPVMERFQKEMERDKSHAPPSMQPVIEVLPLLQYVTVVLDLKDDTLGKMVLQPIDVKSKVLAKIESQAKLFQQRSKEDLAGVRADFGDRSSRMDATELKVLDLLDKILDAMTVKKTDAEVVISLKPTKGIGLEIVETILGGFTRRARAIEDFESDTEELESDLEEMEKIDEPDPAP